MLVLSACQKRSNTCASISGSMPSPESVTCSCAKAPSCRSSTCTRPLVAVNLIALESRFRTICCSLAESPRTRADVQAPRSIRTPFEAALGSTDRNRLIHYATQLDGLSLDPQRARDDPRNIQEIVDQLCLQTRIPLDALDRAQDLLFRQRFAAQKRGPAEDRVERRAQLVAQHRQELVLHPVGGFRRRARAFGRLLERGAFRGRTLVNFSEQVRVARIDVGGTRGRFESRSTGFRCGPGVRSAALRAGAHEPHSPAGYSSWGV